jgi:DNA modification methylase
MSIRILNCDVLEGLAQLPDESVHCVVTSPPYWGLRDYGVDGQIGLEPTPAEFVVRMVGVFREVRRVLRKDGTCWMNLGDSYAGSWGAQSRGDEYPGGLEGTSPIQAHSIKASVRDQSGTGSLKRTPGLKSKDLIGIPWRVALALQADGWWLRSDIIWSKPNPMPESVTDRPTKAHEYIFLLTKSERYHYDADAVREPASYLQPNSPDSISSPYGQGFTRRAKGNAKTFRGGVYVGGKSFDNDAQMERDSHGNAPNETLSRNKRSVWTIATAPFPEAHFATFPPELPEICIKAGCPVGGTVLDPFGGAGTTGLVADRLQRNAILIELNPEYAAMAERRINGDRGGLLDLMEAAE